MDIEEIRRLGREGSSRPASGGMTRLPPAPRWPKQPATPPEERPVDAPRTVAERLLEAEQMRRLR